METGLSALKTLASPRCLVALVGYALYRAVSYNSYVTGFTLADAPIGYIADIGFLAATNLGFIPAALAVALYYNGKQRGKRAYRPARKSYLTKRENYHPAGENYRPLSLNSTAPALLLVCSYLFALTVGPLIGRQSALVLLGLSWGVATFLLSCAWAEVLAINSSPMVLIVQLATATLFSAALSTAFGFALPPQASMLNGAICCVLLACSLWCLRSCRAHSSVYAAEAEGHATRAALRQISVPLVGSLLFEMVIGMVNMYAATSGSLGMITASTPLLGMALCALVTIAFVFVSARLPHPAAVYLGAFPLIIAVFLLLPFFGGEYGEQLSPLFYSGYVFTALIANHYSYQTGVNHRARLYVLFAVISGCTRLALVIGLLAGSFFGSIQVGDEALHLTFIAAVSAYLLMTAIVAFAFNGLRVRRNHEQQGGFHSELERQSSNAREGGLEDGPKSVLEGVLEGEANGGVPQRVSSGLPQGLSPKLESGLEIANQLRQRAESLAVKHHLTHRECDVLVRLALGNSASYIAEDLVLTTNTVNGYIKSLYSKLHVNKKQHIINLFDDIVFAPHPTDAPR